MAWYRCIGGSSPTPVVEPTLTLKYENATTGSTTYTVDDAGIYLIAVTFSLAGTGSITLPSGKTAMYSGDFTFVDSQNREKGTRIVVAELGQGDIITMSTAVGSWNAFSKVVLKLPFAVTTLVDSNKVSDGEMNYTLSTGDGTILCIVTAWARQKNSANLYDFTGFVTDSEMVAGYTGVNTMFRAFICDADNFPTITARGYDGGGVIAVVLQ